MSQTSQFERERAKRLYAAIMSCQNGTSFSTEYKRIGSEPISDFWYKWAAAISRKWTALIDERVTQLLLKREKQVIQ